MAIERKGYGQVEPNHLSAQRTGQIYAQTPAADAIETLENGMFLKEDGAAGVLNTTGNGAWMLVYNEVKLYDNQRQGYQDFAMTTESSVGGLLVPRMFKINIGDRYTTNMVGTDVVGELGEILAPAEVGGVGVLTKSTLEADVSPKFEIIKVYTMPDGQPAVKVNCIG